MPSASANFGSAGLTECETITNAYVVCGQPDLTISRLTSHLWIKSSIFQTSVFMVILRHKKSIGIEYLYVLYILTLVAARAAQTRYIIASK